MPYGTIGEATIYTTKEAATEIGVAKVTLLRWISEGRESDVARDKNDHRIWIKADIERFKRLRDKIRSERKVRYRKEGVNNG